MKHLGDVDACLTEKIIDDDALSFVLNIISSPPKGASLCYYEGVGAATDLKEKMNLCLQTLKSIKSSLKLKEFQTRDEIKEYLISKSKTVIFTTSCCSEMDTTLSHLNQSNAHAIDLLIIDDASMIPSRDIEATLCLPGVRNVALACEIENQESILFKELYSKSTGRHQFTVQYDTPKETKKGIMDAKLQVTIDDL